MSPSQFEAHFISAAPTKEDLDKTLISIEKLLKLLEKRNGKIIFSLYF